MVKFERKLEIEKMVDGVMAKLISGMSAEDMIYIAKCLDVISDHIETSFRKEGE